MQNRTEDRPAEYIRQLEEENQSLRGRLKAADLEIKRIHNHLLLAKAAAIAIEAMLHTLDMAQRERDVVTKHMIELEQEVGRLRKELAAYEDTGLEPEDLKSTVDIDYVRIMELLKADKDGRLVVLTVKTKTTVYVVGEKRIMECFIAEAYIDDARGLEYMVSFDCDDDCDGCPFNSWRQDFSGEYSCDGEYGEGCILGSGFGKTFFLTREEAEAALAGKGGDLSENRTD